MLRFIRRFDLSANDREQFYLPSGAFSGLLYFIRTKKSLAASAFNLKNAAVSEGMIHRVTRDGKQLQSEDVFTYGYLTDHFSGLPAVMPSTAEGETEYQWRPFEVPFQLPTMPNTLRTRSASECLITLDVLDIEALAGEGETECVVEVYGKMAPGTPEIYELHISEHDVEASGQGRIDFTIPHSNIAALIIADPTNEEDEADTVLRTIGIQVNGGVMVDNIRDVMLYTLSALNGRASLAVDEQPTMGVVSLAQGLADSQNQNVEVSLGFATGGRAQITSLRILPGVRVQESFRAVDAYTRARQGTGVTILPEPPPRDRQVGTVTPVDVVRPNQTRFRRA